MYIKEQLTLYKVFKRFFLLSQPDPSSVMTRLINGLFHSRCLDVHANEIIIVLKLELSE